MESLAPLPPEIAQALYETAKLLNAPPNSVHVQQGATKAWFKSVDLDKYRVIEFATHGLLNNDLPGLTEAALVLTPALPQDNGLLLASEIAALRLNADWVILSACNTAGADTAGGQPLSGLARAFFNAGAHTLMVSHWPVRPDPTKMLMVGAIESMNKNPAIGRAEALRKAEIDLISNPVYSHPLFWAPFVVVGEGAPGR